MNHPLFDYAQAALDAAPPAWRSAARSAVLHLAATMPNGFDADHVWRELEDRRAPIPPEPRALGGVLKSLSREGRIRKTGAYRESRRAVNHGRPIPVWRAA